MNVLDRFSMAIYQPYTINTFASAATDSDFDFSSKAQYIAYTKCRIYL